MNNYFYRLFNQLESYVNDFIESGFFDEDLYSLINNLYYEILGAVNYALSREDLTKYEADYIKSRINCLRFEKLNCYR